MVPKLAVNNNQAEARRFFIIRTATNLSQAEARRLLKCSRAQMSELESGRVSPSNSAIARKFLLKMGASFNYLYEGSLESLEWRDEQFYQRVLELEQLTPSTEWRQSDP